MVKPTSSFKIAANPFLVTVISGFGRFGLRFTLYIKLEEYSIQRNIY